MGTGIVLFERQGCQQVTQCVMQVTRALYSKPTDDGWAFGLDEEPSKTLASQLLVQFLIVPLPHHGDKLPTHPTGTTTHTTSLCTGDAVYIYGSPFPQLQAEALQHSVRCGQVSNVICSKHHTVAQDAKESKTSPCLLLIDFKSLPGKEQQTPHTDSSHACKQHRSDITHSVVTHCLKRKHPSPLRVSLDLIVYSGYSFEHTIMPPRSDMQAWRVVQCWTQQGLFEQCCFPACTTRT